MWSAEEEFQEKSLMQTLGTVGTELWCADAKGVGHLKKVSGCYKQDTFQQAG